MRSNIKTSSGIRDISTMFFSKGFTIIVSIAMQSLLAWQLGAEARGQYALCLIIVSILSAVLLFGVDWAAKYYLASKKFSADQVITFGYIYTASICIFALFTLPFLFDIELNYFTRIPDVALDATILWCLTNMIYCMSSAILAGLSRFKYLAFITFFKCFLTLLFSYVMFENSSVYSLVVPIYADAMSGFLVSIFVITYLFDNQNYRPSIPAALASKSNMNYGSRFLFASFGMIVNTHIATIVLSYHVSSSELGVFALAYAFLTQLSTLGDIVNSVVQPRVSASSSGRPELVSLSIRILGPAIIVLGGLLALSSTIWMPIIFSLSFSDASELLWWLLPGVLLKVLARCLFPYFNGVNKPEKISITLFITIIANFFALLLLVPLYGAKAAAASISIAYLLSFMYIFYQFLKASGLSYKEILCLRLSDINLLLSMLPHNNYRR